MLLAFYPDGRLPSRAWWWPVGGIAAALLFDVLHAGIEWVLRRWLVYGMLTVLVFGVYLAASAAAGTVLGRRPLPVVLAAAVIAVGLAPVRDRLQRARTASFSGNTVIRSGR